MMIFPNRSKTTTPNFQVYKARHGPELAPCFVRIPQDLLVSKRLPPSSNPERCKRVGPPYFLLLSLLSLRPSHTFRSDYVSIVDNRSGRSFQVPITDNTIPATSLRQLVTDPV